ncbi:MAG: hypothetical protein LBC18_09390 [Opitutaceae bacterium]|jgi:hypothetical protein|nr:hypothetical protein [Opitutaceae bacterium]
MNTQAMNAAARLAAAMLAAASCQPGLRAAGAASVYDKAVARFDAAGAAGITAEKNAVSAWAASRGRGVLRAPDAKARPRYHADGGAAPCVRFDGRDDFLVLDGVPELRLGAISVFVVARFDAGPAGRHLFGVSGEMRFDLHSGRSQFTSAIGNELHARKRGLKMDARPHVFELAHVLLPAEAGILAPGRFMIDGALSGRPFTRSTDIVSDTLTFGARGGLDGFFKGDIFEIVIFREDLPAAERALLRESLGEKWGVPVVSEALPAGIPVLKPVAINRPGEFASLGIYHQTPESPDGRRLAYITFETPPVKEDAHQPFTLWIRDRELRGEPRALPRSGLLATNHNGAVVQWIDNRAIACAAFLPPARRSEKPRRVVQIVDATTGALLHGPFTGAFLGEGVSGGRILLGVDGPGNVGPPGVYVFDTNNGAMTRVFATAGLEPFAEGMSWPAFRKDPGRWVPTHPHFSPSGKRIGACLAAGGGVVLFFVCNPDGSDLRYWGMDEPLHQLWFDDDTISGSDELVNDGEPDNLAIRRWTLDRRLVETLGGEANHPALSPDRRWCAGETFYAGSPIVLHIYRRGRTVPAAIVPLENPKVIWRDNGHANPSFSRDGRRLYFHTATQDNLKQACFVDLSPLVDAPPASSR